MSRRLTTFFARLALPAMLLAHGSASAAQGATCSQPDFGTEASGVRPELALDERVLLEADNVLLEKEGLSRLVGAVRLRQGDKEFSAENLDYDDATRRVTVRSESVFRNPELIISSREASFDLNAESGAFSDTDYVLPTRAARGSSEKITLTTAGTAQLEGSRYTTCGPQSDAWYIEASDIRLNHETGLGTARNARLRFGGVPILYAPWFQFPIDDRRRSGLLFPTVGDSDKTGFDMRWPVYLNLAPNYDATITPRYMSDRGMQFTTEGRYLMRRGEGRAAYEYLDHDEVYGDARSFFAYDHVGLVNRRLSVEATYAEVSDPRYFEDLGGDIDSASITHLERAARFTYQAPASYRVQLLAQGYQRIDSQIDEVVEEPYQRLPQLRFDALTRNDWHDTRAGVQAELVNFVRSDSVQGQRVDLQPYVRYLHDQTAWYVSSQADLRYTRYRLTDSPGADAPERTLPVLSAETGLRFERLTADASGVQTLEPRAFALYVPYDNQDDLPLFDTGEPDFDFVQLFARNRFSGADRIADARHVAAALTTRRLDAETGSTRYSVSFGQLYRLASPRVGIPGFPAPERGATEFIGEIVYNITARWSAVGASQWSPESSEFERGNVGIRFRDYERDQRLDASYRYRRGVLEQADVSFSWPLFGAWRFAARSRYALDDDSSRDAFAGVEYETCCWAIRTSYRRYITSSDGEFNSGVYLQLELKGLTGIGSGFTGLLPMDDGDDLNARTSGGARVSSGLRHDGY